MTYLAVEAVRNATPPTWDWVPLRRIAQLRRTPNVDGTATLLSLSSERGLEPRPEDGGRQLPSDALIPSYWLVETDDLVINPMWAIGGGVGVSRISGAVSPAYRVYQLSKAIWPRFLDYYLRSRPLLVQYGLVVRGITTFDRSVTREDFEGLPVPVPSVSVQRAIADYLDAETARIDALIQKKQLLVVALDERFSADVFRSIAQGVRRHETWKKSGLSWIAAIPAEWGTPTVSANFALQLGKMLNHEATSGPDQHPYLRNANVQWDRIDIDDLALMHFDQDDQRRCKLRPGDLLVCEGGEVGRSAIWDGRLSPCYYQKALHRVRPHKAASVRYLLYCLRAAANLSVFAVEGNLSTIVHLTEEQLRVQRFPWPPSDEQDEIVRHLDQETSRMEDARDLITGQLALLAEHRQALITAAVTGELAIPGVAA